MLSRLLSQHLCRVRDKIHPHASVLSSRVKTIPMSQWETDLKLFVGSHDWTSCIVESYRAESHKRLLASGRNASVTRHLLYQDEVLEVRFLLWPRMYKSGIHNHSDKGCWMYVVHGDRVYESLCDTTFPYTTTGVRSLPKGQWSFVHNAMGYHSVCNNGDDIAATLHVYSPPGAQTSHFTHGGPQASSQ